MVFRSSGLFGSWVYKTKIFMRVAVLYTGALRTIRKTLPYFRRNVLLHADVHVFAQLQNDTTLSEEEQAAWLQSELSSHLVSLAWFRVENYPGWIQWRESTLSTLGLNDGWTTYLRDSGSMLEYLQLFNAYQDLCAQERTRGYRYDYVVRLRPDNMLAHPLDFRWLSWTEEEVAARWSRLQALRPTQDPLTLLNEFMTSVWADHLLDHVSHFTGQCRPAPGFIYPTDLRAYLQQGSYILTMRKNNIYVVRRELFHWVPALGYLYGSLRAPQAEPEYWANSENQFQSACYYAGLTVHDYSSNFDEQSLYEYEEARYFDERGEIKNPHMVYCLVRN